MTVLSISEIDGTYHYGNIRKRRRESEKYKLYIRYDEIRVLLNYRDWNKQMQVAMGLRY